MICHLLIGQFLDFQTKIENKYGMDSSIGQNINCQTILYMCNSAIGSNNSIFWRENIGFLRKEDRMARFCLKPGYHLSCCGYPMGLEVYVTLSITNKLS